MALAPSFPQLRGPALPLSMPLLLPGRETSSQSLPDAPLIMPSAHARGSSAFATRPRSRDADVPGREISRDYLRSMMTSARGWAVIPAQRDDQRAAGSGPAEHLQRHRRTVGRSGTTGGF